MTWNVSRNRSSTTHLWAVCSTSCPWLKCTSSLLEISPEQHDFGRCYHCISGWKQARCMDEPCLICLCTSRMLDRDALQQLMQQVHLQHYHNSQHLDLHFFVPSPSASFNLSLWCCTHHTVPSGVLLSQHLHPHPATHQGYHSFAYTKSHLF